MKPNIGLQQRVLLKPPTTIPVEERDNIVFFRRKEINAPH